MITIKRSELKSLYDANPDFAEYVQKYCKRDNITIEEGLQHAMVWEKAKDIEYRMNN